MELMLEMFKRLFETQEDIEAVIEKVKNLKSRDNQFFLEIMKADCLRQQFADLFNSLIERTKPQDDNI